MFEGDNWADICRDIVNCLPGKVYVSFDIDGLEPSLCPGTGTPVPGGLSFQQASLLLSCLKENGREIIDADLYEVCPGAPDNEWNANAGPRIL